MNTRRNLLPRLLAGLQVGILGGLGILAWLLVLSYWNFRAPWAVVNLFAAALRNSVYWGRGFSFSTFTGLAAHLFACGLLGILIGWVLPRPRAETRISVPGLVFGVIISLLTYEFFWRRYVPGLNDLLAPASLFIAHMIFGMCLAQFPKYYLKLAPAEAAPEPEPYAGQ